MMMARYQCSVCGFIYDEAQEGVRWEALPKDWACPGCGSDQSLFTGQRRCGDWFGDRRGS
jgi:rubredoxin